MAAPAVLFLLWNVMTNNANVINVQISWSRYLLELWIFSLKIVKNYDNCHLPFYFMGDYADVRVFYAYFWSRVYIMLVNIIFWDESVFYQNIVNSRDLSTMSRCFARRCFVLKKKTQVTTFWPTSFATVML